MNIRFATIADAEVIIDNLRETPDVEYINEYALKAALKTSAYAWVGLVDEVPIAVWGIYYPSMMDRSGFIWMVTTNQIEDHAFTFLRHSRIALDMVLQKCDYLYGVVAPEFNRSQKWLKWMKFEIGHPVNFNGKLMMTFKRRPE